MWKVIANAGTGFMGLLATGMPAKKLTLPSPLTAAIAAIRRGSSMDKPRRVKSFLAHGRPHTVLRRIIRFALTGACLVEALDETAGQVVLSDSASWTEGFFYPVFLTDKGNNETLVEVGIKSKTFQGGPIAWRHHDRCFNGLKAAVFADWT